MRRIATVKFEGFDAYEQMLTKLGNDTDRVQKEMVGAGLRILYEKIKGANATFVLWGLLYFVFLLLERLTGIDQKLKWAYRIPTLLIVLLAWVLFRSTSLSAAGQYYGYLFGVGSLGFSDIVFLNQFGGSAVVFALALIGCTPLPKNLFMKLKTAIGEIPGKVLTYGYATIVFILSALACILDTYNPFIYFNF